jgi:hypothetical protein
MTPMPAADAVRRRPSARRSNTRGCNGARSPAARALLAALAAAAVLVLAGCSTGHPGTIARGDLAEAQTFPFFKLYWVGLHFDGHPLAAVDGLKSYIPSIGDTVYYGDCVRSKGIFGGGSCQLPLQVTTVIYHLHSNKALGPQRNIVVRGVPATVYDGGHSIEVYSGRVAIDIFSDTYARAIGAAQRLLPVNAPGSASADLPAPIYCPGLSGKSPVAVQRVMAALPGQACQRAAATVAYTKAVRGY